MTTYDTSTLARAVRWSSRLSQMELITEPINASSNNGQKGWTEGEGFCDLKKERDAPVHSRGVRALDVVRDA